MVMEERSKRFRLNPIRAAEGFLFMEISSQAMERYAEANSDDLDPAVKARVNRFLGRYMDYKGYYKKSEKYYRRGLEYFDRSEKPEEKVNRLEFSGFLSYSLMKQNRTDKGIELAAQTIKDFDETEEGKWLKDNNYYTWAVWKSGIELRTSEYILRKKVSQHIGLAKAFVTDAEKILKMPDGNTESFRLRLDELDTTRDLMNKKKL
jgi:tetratricopeptide (TPR) repeat protein